MRFSKREFYFCFCLKRMLETEKQKKEENRMEKGQNNYINRYFSGCHPKMDESEKIIFSKNCLTLFVSGREKNAHFRAHYLFWPFGAQNSVGSTIKIVVSEEIAQNQKWYRFLKKVFFDMGEKVFFLTVFWKLCSSENTIFIVLSEKHSSCNKKLYVEKKHKTMKNSGLFLNMAKRCFLFVCFSGLMVLWFGFLCVW